MTVDHPHTFAERKNRFLETVSRALDDGDAADATESRQQIADAVAADPEARGWYIEAMLLEADLADAHAGTGVGDVVDLLAHETADDSRQGRRWRLAAALMMLLAMLISLGGTVAWQALASVERAAALGQISNARLAMPPAGDDAESLAVGRLLTRERLRLDSGGVEITLRSGGVLVVEGPAELDLTSDRSAFLHRGSIVVRQPESGRECFVETPAATATIDRGECGIAVTAALVTEVQNYTGRVVVSRDIGRFPLRLDAETAVRIVPGDAASDETLAFDAGRFLRRLPASPGMPRPATPGTEGFYRSFGRPQVEAMTIPRTNEPVMIDGQLNEWPSEPAFRATRSADGSGPEWLEGWMLYDAAGLYVAARVGDPHPLRNAVDPNTRLETLWHGGALQLFLSLDRSLGWPAEGKAPAYYNCRHIQPPLAEEVKATNPRLLTLFLWHHAPSGTDRLALNSALGTDAAEITDGFTGRFAPAADGRGYVLEYRISWETLGVADDPPQPGDQLATCWELHFSDETGRLWRDQIIEVRNPGEPPAIYPFESAATWGRAEFQ
jgi:hypothetical protein